MKIRTRKRSDGKSQYMITIPLDIISSFGLQEGDDVNVMPDTRIDGVIADSDALFRTMQSISYGHIRDVISVRNIHDIPCKISHDGVDRIMIELIGIWSSMQRFRGRLSPCDAENHGRMEEVLLEICRNNNQPVEGYVDIHNNLITLKYYDDRPEYAGKKDAMRGRTFCMDGFDGVPGGWFFLTDIEVYGEHSRKW